MTTQNGNVDPGSGDQAIVAEAIELAWPEQHQPLPHRSPRTLPPTQPAPLISGLLETVLTNSPTVPTANVNSKLIGQNTNPLTTVPPVSPSTSETLVVQLASAPATQHRTQTGALAIPGAAAVAPTLMFTSAPTGTQLVGIVLSLIPSVATTGQPFVTARVAIAGVGEILPFVLGLGSPFVYAFNGPIASSNVTLAVDARGTGAPACQINFAVYGIDL